MAKRKASPSEDELIEFRRMLLARRDLILAAHPGLLAKVQWADRANAGGPMHPADFGMAQMLDPGSTSMAEHERNLLGETHAALWRIDERTYGICQATGQPIDKKRLLARPWTRYGVEDVLQAPDEER